MTPARITPAAAKCGHVADLPVCGHCDQPVVATWITGDWHWRHLSGRYSCGEHARTSAAVGGWHLVAYTLRITTTYRQED